MTNSNVCPYRCELFTTTDEKCSECARVASPASAADFARMIGRSEQYARDAEAARENARHARDEHGHRAAAASHEHAAREASDHGQHAVADYHRAEAARHMAKVADLQAESVTLQIRKQFRVVTRAQMALYRARAEGRSTTKAENALARATASRATLIERHDAYIVTRDALLATARGLA